MQHLEPEVINIMLISIKKTLRSFLIIAYYSVRENKTKASNSLELCLKVKKGKILSEPEKFEFSVKENNENVKLKIVIKLK